MFRIILRKQLLYRGYEETYDLEKDIWKIVQEYHLENDFYYVDLTDENGSINCDLACVINTGLNHTKFKNVPVVAYYERGTLVDVAFGNKELLC